MVGIVIVSHSSTLAEGVAELAREMGDSEVRVEPAGGLDEPGALGTDAVRVLAAIERADSGDGVVVLMDLGSAVLSAEMALEMLSPELRERVLLSEAPLVEGAVAAAVTARLGAGRAAVASEARGGLQAKAAQLGSPGGAAPETESVPVAVPEPAEAALERRLTVTNEHGLHARPAARFVQTAGRFDADVSVRNVSATRGPASARSLNALATLGVRQGHEILVEARGPQAAEALAALEDLVVRGLRDEAAPLPTATPRQPAPKGGLSGIAASPGLALGPARHLRAKTPEVPAHDVADPAHEQSGLDEAIAAVRGEVETARASVHARAGEAEAAIFEAHLLLLSDEALLGPTGRGIESGRNGARAWNDAVEALAGEYGRLEDDYQRARVADLRALGDRVLVQLGGGHPETALEEPGVVVAAELTPAQTAGLDPAKASAIVTAYGGPTSHSAILARALGLPAVVAVGEAILAVAEGTELAVDGDAGTVLIEPATDVEAEFAGRLRARRRAEVGSRARAHEPAITLDGTVVEVAANIGSAADAAAAVEAGADGVGLLRTEFLFLDRDSPPDEEEQFDVYRRIAETLAGRSLVLRTLDAGADKPLAFLEQAAEDNPFLGVRGIRLSLERPELLATQLRAAKRVAAEFPLKVMFPMVAALSEYRAALELTPDGLETGIMVEVPATALAAPVFAPHVAFFSIGTNDLTQYTLAADRGNARVAGLADGLHPAVLRLVGAVTAAAEPEAKWVGVCGELAGDVQAVPLLLGLGVTELSVAPALVPAVKDAVRRVELVAARQLALEAVGLASGREVRERSDPETGSLTVP